MPNPPPPRGKIPSRASVPDDPPKPPAEPLAEVERALSILHGRHPDAVRAERETNIALSAKKAATEELAKRARVEEKRRWITRGVVGVLVTVAATVAWSQYSKRRDRATAVEAALAPLIAPYLSRGFTRVSPSRFAEERLELEGTDPTCFVALASRSPGDGAMTVERPSGALDGVDSVAWCSCGAESATARLDHPKAGGIAVLRASAPELGGDHGLFFLDPRPHVIATPDECSHESLDAWIDKGAPVRANDGALDEETRGALARAGFAAAGSAIPALPFAVVRGADDTCALALSTSADDLLSLRLPGGQRPIAEVKGPIGFCSSHATNLSVWRKGVGEVVIERVGAGRVGGTLGLRELLPRLGMPAVEPWVSEGDLAWDASATLRASGIASPEITVSTDGRAVTQAHLIALSIAGAMVRPDTTGSSGFACEPPLTRESRSAICVQSAALAWHVAGAVGKAGIAEATLPFWMRAFSGATDPAALAAQLSLVKLGRRLATDGFDATTLDGVTEIEGGAIVTGRAGDDAIVAVQLTREAPWASPCSTGDPWRMDSDPGIVSLAPGAQLKLACEPKVTGARDRRTVVFRHVAASPPPR
jgi:hypothetical protein